MRSIDHNLSLGKRAPPAAGKVSVDGPISNAREEAGRAHVRVFGFHAETGDIVIDLNVEYIWEIVLTNDGSNLAARERFGNFFDLIHRVVPKAQTFL